MGNCTDIFSKRRGNNGNSNTEQQQSICSKCGLGIPPNIGYLRHLTHCQAIARDIANRQNGIHVDQQNYRAGNEGPARSVYISRQLHPFVQVDQQQQEQLQDQIILQIQQNNNENNLIALQQQQQQQQLQQQQQQKKKAQRPALVWTRVQDETDKTKYNWKQMVIGEIVEVDLIKQLSSQDIKNLSFEEKQIWFRDQLERLRVPWTKGAEWLEIHTDNVLLTSLNAIELVNLHKEVKISINGDKVQDAGGLLREWIHMISKDIFDKNTGLFCLANTSEVTYRINHEADQCDHIISCFRLFGRVIGKAIFERIPLEVYIDKTITRQILNSPVSLDDIFSLDQELYKSWNFMKETKLGEDDFIGNMVFERKDGNGKRISVPLIKNGEEVEINNENKLQFIDLSIDYISFQSVKPFINAIKSGIYSVIPQHLISIFDVNELEMILNGLPFISTEDWEANTVYKNGYSRSSSMIREFWRVMRGYDQLKLQKFLHFCTGSSRTSIEGFKKLESNRGNFANFCIEQVTYDEKNPYPKAHTCFNRLELPQYPSAMLLRKYMHIIVSNDLDGIFGME